MTDSLIPDWIKSIKLQEDQQSMMEKVKQERRLLEEKTVKADGPEFWKQFLEQVQITVQSLPEIGISAQLVSLGGEAQGHMIELTRSGSFPGRIYTNIFYDGPGATVIRCHPGELASFELTFNLAHKHELVVSASVRSNMNPAQAAQCVIEPMVKRLRRE